MRKFKAPSARTSTHVGDGFLGICIEGPGPTESVYLTATGTKAVVTTQVAWLLGTAPNALRAFVSQAPADDVWTSEGDGLRADLERGIVYLRVVDAASRQPVELPLSIAGFRAFVDHACGEGSMEGSLARVPGGPLGRTLFMLPERHWIALESSNN